MGIYIGDLNNYCFQHIWMVLCPVKRGRANSIGSRIRNQGIWWKYSQMVG